MHPKLAEWLNTTGAVEMAAVEEQRVAEEAQRKEREMEKSRLQDAENRRKDLGNQLIKAAKMKDPRGVKRLVEEGVEVTTHYHPDRCPSPRKALNRPHV